MNFVNNVNVTIPGTFFNPAKMMAGVALILNVENA